MRAAKALGANHVTVEHPEDDEHTARLGKIAEEEGILMAYHGHMQQTPTLWDTALAQSSGNSMNLDFGHYIAAENENPLQIIKDKHASIASMHLKIVRRNQMVAETSCGEPETPQSQRWLPLFAITDTPSQSPLN
jgi:sugar phosphate isomerase/epimerase